MSPNLPTFHHPLPTKLITLVVTVTVNCQSITRATHHRRWWSTTPLRSNPVQSSTVQSSPVQSSGLRWPQSAPRMEVGEGGVEAGAGREIYTYTFYLRFVCICNVIYLCILPLPHMPNTRTHTCSCSPHCSVAIHVWAPFIRNISVTPTQRKNGPAQPSSMRIKIL